LPPQQRQVFVLSRQKRMKYSEIASHMGISKETVKKYLQLATRSVISHIQSGKCLHISFLFLADHIAQQ
jgi:RNA polymerase sigma factor (sigma-70 family)